MAFSALFVPPTQVSFVISNLHSIFDIFTGLNPLCLVSGAPSKLLHSSSDFVQEASEKRPRSHFLQGVKAHYLC